MENSFTKANPLLVIKEANQKRLHFKRHHSYRYKRVGESWRYPRGIDNRFRKQFSGMPALPGKVYKKPAIIRHMLPNGLREVIVRNVNDLEALTSVNRRYCATIDHSVGARKRVEIVNQAKLLGIHVTNEKARLMEAIEQ